MDSWGQIQVSDSGIGLRDRTQGSDSESMQGSDPAIQMSLIRMSRIRRVGSDESDQMSLIQMSRIQINRIQMSLIQEADSGIGFK